MNHPTGLAVDEHLPPDQSTGQSMIVLVHGSLDRSSSFTRVLRRLADLHVVVYDRRGYHRSRRVAPLGTSLDRHIDDLIAVIDGRPAAVVGHSYGGDIALGAALRCNPGTSIASVGAYEPPLPWMPFWSTKGASSRTSTSGDDPAAAAARFYRRVVGREAWERLSDRAKDERRADGPALVAELDAIRIEHAPFDVGAMRLPALYGRGEQSMPHHRQGVAWLAEHTPGSELVDFIGASHGAHLTHPDAFADFVRRVVERASPGIATTGGGDAGSRAGNDTTEGNTT
jgi:pimeloyl-ACP methyl ester carboxylesterase